MTGPRRLTALILVFALAACGGGYAPAPGAPDASGEARSARVDVLISVPRAGPPTLATSAWLLAHRDVDAEVAEVLAGGPGDALVDGAGCALADHDALLDEAMANLAPDAAVRLLDGGDLLVRAAGSVVRLEPRHLPEVVPFVTGVSYRGEPAPGLTPELIAGDEAQVSAFGGQDVGRFDARVPVPALPRIAAVGAVDPAEATPTVARGADLAVRWAAAGDGEPVTVILGDGRGVELRCRVADSGRAVLPAASITAFLDAASGQAVELAVERRAGAGFAAAGLDGGEVRVLLRDVVAVRVP